jgi:hypothetical protein
MARQCFACSGSIRPADGPALLWDVQPPQPSRPAREAFHLACWLAWRAERDAVRKRAAA